MIRIHRYIIIQFLYLMLDTFFMGLAIFLACKLRYSTVPFEITVHNVFVDPVNPFRMVFYFWILVTLLVNNAHGLYQTKREIFETVEVWQVIRSVFLSCLIVIVGIFAAKVQQFPRTILFFTAIFMTLFFALWRILKRIFVDYLVAKGYNNFNVLIIGAGRVGRSLSMEIKKRPGLGLNIIGFLDDFKENTTQEDKSRIIGKVEDFRHIARREFVDKIFISSHLEETKFLKLLEEAKQLKIAVRVVPHGFELLKGEFSRYNIGYIPVLEYYDAEGTRRQVSKRLFDFTCSLIASIFLLPIFITIAILIKLDSRGPVIYTSYRYGRNCRNFKMYKFRSMVDNADALLKQYEDQNEVDGPIFKIKKDPRITRIGRFLRKYSLDELPQLINVLKGDMSLVGPRPLSMNQVEKEDLRQLQRLEVRPGITGLWQIRGRSDISFSRLVRWDVWYINNWSFWLDINILLQTFPVVIKGKGAY